jgi:peptidoglycan hydrolase-like protein with peptidoglycan-binding domain
MNEFGSQIEDVEAIDRYMRTTPLKTPEAFKIKDAYIIWYDQASWWDKNVSKEFYDAQRTRRNQLNIANQPTEAAKAEVREVIVKGVTTEEMQGKSKPAIDPQTGRVGSQVKKPTVPATPSTMPKVGDPMGPILLDLNKIYPLIRKGSKGPDVVAWQSVLGVATDGVFGPGTELATIAWQKKHGLQADGVVGPNSWNAAKTDARAAMVTPDVTTMVSTFAPPVKPAPTFAPSVKPAPTFAPPVKPAPTFAPPVKPTTPILPPEKPSIARKVVQTASIFDVTKWSLPAKIFTGLTLIGGAGYALIKGKAFK